MTRDEIIGFVLAKEGGLVDDPADPGGRTNFGITQRYLDSARVQHPDLNLPAAVDALTRQQAAKLYEVNEWAQIRGVDLPSSIALLVMDCAVNSGVHEAVKLLQLALGMGATADGVMGPITLAAAARAAPQLEDEYTARRAYHFAQLDAREDKFELGWMRRLLEAYRLAIGA